MSSIPSDFHQDYESLRAEIMAQVTGGDLDRALDLSTQAVDLASKIGDPCLLDTAICNRAGLLVARGEGETTLGELRMILMRSSASSVRFLASYALSHYYDQQEELQKCRFYSESALRYAKLDDNAASLVKAHNRLANLNLLESYFEPALDGYLEALKLQGSDDSVEAAKVLSNIGYCQAVLGEPITAFRSLSRSLRMVRRLAADRWLHLPMLGLSYAYLEMGRYERAARYAKSALMNAEVGGPYQQNHVKNALYLLGEAQKLCGRDQEAFECFTHLQLRFYPDQPMVVEVLMATDIRKLINLMA